MTPTAVAEQTANTMKLPSVAVVGGGLLGMQLAANLRSLGHPVTLFEAAPQLGGLADSWTIGDVTWDRHYHVTLLSDTRLQKLINDLGLTNEVRWVETKTGFYTGGRLHSMSNSLEFLRFPPLGLLDKLRLGGTIFYASKLKNWRRLETVPVADWLRKLSGRRTTDAIWLPLLRAKLGEDYRHASAAFIWAIIARMYAARRTGLKREMFGYVRGGYARLLAHFAGKLYDAGVEVRTCTPVAQVDSGRVTLGDGSTEAFDRIIVTAAAPVARRLLPGLSEDEAKRFDGLRYQGIVCASVLLKKPLAHYYVTNITDPAPFTAVIEMTALVDPNEFGGKHLVYLPKYVAPDDPLFDQPDRAIRESFLAAVQRMYPHFDPADVLAFRVSRVRYVLPIPTLNYSDNLPPMETSLPEVWAVNAAHIVNGTLNVNETLQLADRATAEVRA